MITETFNTAIQELDQELKSPDFTATYSPLTISWVRRLNDEMKHLAKYFEANPILKDKGK